MNQIITKWSLLWMLILALLVGCNSTSVEQGEKTQTTPNGSLTPSPTALQTGVTILADGVVQLTQPTLPMAFKSSGKLQSVNVHTGDQIKEGDILAQLDEAEPIGSYHAAVTYAELSVLRAEQALDDLYSNAEIARTDALNDLILYAQAVRDAQYQLENYDTPIYLQGLDIIEALDLTKAQLDMASEAFEPYRYDSKNDPTRQEYLKALNEAQAKYNAAVKRLKYDYELQVAQANLNKARRNYDQYTAGPSPDDLALAEAELANAQAQLTLAQDNLEAAIQSQDDIYLIAPWAGTVLSIEVAPGVFISAGTPILTLMDTAQVEFETNNLSERDIAQITPGQTALITLKAYPDQSIEAQVLRIGWQAGEAIGDAIMFPVVLKLSQTDLMIRPGMTGRVEIYCWE